MAVITSVSEPDFLGKLIFEIFQSPAEQVALLLSEVSFKFCNFEVVFDPFVKSPRTEQRDLLGDSSRDLGWVGGLDYLGVEQLCLFD